MEDVGKRNTSKCFVDFGARLNASGAAKKALLEKWQTNKVDVHDPAFLKKQAARQAAAAVRAQRDAHRKAERDSAKARAIADRKAAQEAAEAQAINDQIEREASEADAAARLIAHEEQRKAARDARYAARKARNARK